jgi:amino acid adenylation domain-containing protein
MEGKEGNRAARDLSARLASLSPEKRALLERRLQTTSESRAPPSRISPRQDAQRPPLSFAQQRLWFLEQLEPGHAFYNLPLVIRFREAGVKVALAAALDEIVKRHEALRTSFVLENGEPVQEIAAELNVALEVADLASVAASEREAEAVRQATAEAMRTFDLTRGPLIRAKLLQLAESDHLLVVTMHHIVSDGWSLGVFSQELNALYAALRAGCPATLPPLPMQYGDFAIWQRGYLQGENLERLLSYWKRKLEGMPALLELPTDWPRPRVQSFEGGTIVRPYDKPTIEALKSLASQQGGTLFMVLLAVFNVLLHRFSGITDMVVGSPIANRSRVEMEGLIGFFANTLVLRTDLSGNPSFREIIARVRETTLEAYAHQDLPFERLVEELSPGRDLSHNPLFQVMFGLQNTDGQATSQNSEAGFTSGISKFDLTLSASETAEGLTCIFEFNTALFRPETIDSLAEAFGVLMQAAAAAPDRSISELPLVSAAQRAALIKEAATAGSVSAAPTVHGLFERKVAATPAAAAVATADRSYSYAEIEARANRLARALRERGAGPDFVVGMCLDRTPDLPVAMLGILKAGAAFLPLDPSHPKDRLAYMMADAGALIVLTHARLLDVLPPFTGEVWCMDRDWQRIAERSPERLPFAGSPENLAYIIYTSGSSGRPKGVMVSHRCACNAAQSLIEAFRLPPSTRVLQFGSLSFDISIYDLLMAVGCGGTLCMASADAVMPGQPLADTLRDLKINAITLPPSALSVVPVTALPDLHLIVCGGETLPGELAVHWAAGRCLINAYGPTETTIWATFFRCSNEETNPPVGRAISRAQVYILDSENEPLPRGFSGEVHIAGAGVARGYLNKPTLTAEHYVPDPFSAEPGSRMYRTGDRARRLPGGDIQFIGRLDHQVKLRGYRIELGEIEAVLSGSPHIREAAVVIQQTPGGEKRIAAYCTLNSDGAADRAGLLAYLRRQLPEFMIPANLHVVAALPVSASGKIDRPKLSTEADTDDKDSGETSLTTATEKKVAEIFAAILEIRHVGVRDSFFDLGGHSLLATRAINRINETFQIVLPLRKLFEFPVVAELALAIERARGRAEKTAPAITRAARRSVIFPTEKEAI